MLSTCALLFSLFPIQSNANGVDASEEAQARRLQVEGRITPRPWVEGHSFDLIERMGELNVPGVSVAVIHEGRIDWAAGYGVRKAGSGEAVTTQTLFQAASISKPVSGMVVLRMAQEGRLELDAPINEMLGEWKLPDGGFAGEVTPRHLMSHTGGTGVHGFPGYRSFDPLPSVVDVLNGSGHANTGQVRRVARLRQNVTYSGGGSTIMQLALSNVSGRDFTSLALEKVLKPLGMTRSTFAQPLPTKLFPDHSAAHGRDGRVVPGEFHTYPEQYPAGLWTTPSDLATFAMEVQRGLRGEKGRVLESKWAREMTTRVMQDSTPGFFLEEFGGETWFGHGGANEGFRCQLYGSLEGDRGVAVMTNSDQGSTIAGEVVRAVSLVYGWPGFLEEAIPSEADPNPMETYVGRYAFGPDRVIYIRKRGQDQLEVEYPPSTPRQLVAVGPASYLIHGESEIVDFQDIQNGLAGSAHFSNAGGQFAQRMDEDERWPIEDMLEGDIDYGIEFYRELHGANPEDPIVEQGRLNNLVSGHWNAGRLEAGLALAELVCELFPKDAGAWAALGQLRCSNQEIEAAVAAHTKCLDVLADDPSLDAGDRAWLEANSKSMLRGLRP